ncbi:hypothetical protein BDP27DRAFT_1371857 [Rhodocollybia butyracea]|uniref:Uncharacterized protein n=1 Tax=Rhodocollybia butyracea TaxID=206335 RepID=A0A9P5PBJ8_9AGAR|nr:hypothetical protein BDP27DRAFT_1371857 [Rhodocollybia butyracea]
MHAPRITCTHPQNDDGRHWNLYIHLYTSTLILPYQAASYVPSAVYNPSCSFGDRSKRKAQERLVNSIVEISLHNEVNLAQLTRTHLHAPRTGCTAKSFDDLAIKTSDYVAEEVKESFVSAKNYIGQAMFDQVRTQVTTIINKGNDKVADNARAVLTEAKTSLIAAQTALTAAHAAIELAENALDETGDESIVKELDFIFSPIRDQIINTCDKHTEQYLKERAEIMMEREIIAASVRHAQTQATTENFLEVIVSFHNNREFSLFENYDFLSFTIPTITMRPTEPATPTTGPPQHLIEKLELLRTYLQHLPPTFPLDPPADQSSYHFSLSTDDIEERGIFGAVSRCLEVCLGQSRDGVIHFKERGARLEVIIKMFDEELAIGANYTVTSRYFGKAMGPP